MLPGLLYTPELLVLFETWNFEQFSCIYVEFA